MTKYPFRSIKKLKADTIALLEEKGTDPDLIQALTNPQDSSITRSDVDVVLQNIEKTFNTIPQKSPLRTSFASDLFEGI